MKTNPVSTAQKLSDLLISVIVPVYNVAPYLDECLESICSQTYKNLEVILIDDGSTDESGKTCDHWREKDPRIRVIHQQNAGVSCARNTGLEVCTGDLISFVDSDDWLDLRMFEKLVRCLRENGADGAMCGFVDYPHGAPVEKGLFPAPPSDFTGTVYQMMRRNGYFASLWAKLFRRSLVFRSGNYVRFDTSLCLGEDEVWLLEVLQNCQSVAFLPEALYFWRPREGSVTRSETLTAKQMSTFKAKEQSLQLIPNDSAAQTLVRGRIYNDCFILKVQAYCAGQQEELHTIKQALHPMRRDWLRSSDILFLRKLKVLVLELEMLLNMPAGLVRWTNLTH